jgi:hypothetical protein
VEPPHVARGDTPEHPKNPTAANRLNSRLVETGCIRHAGGHCAIFHRANPKMWVTPPRRVCGQRKAHGECGEANPSVARTARARALF